MFAVPSCTLRRCTVAVLYCYSNEYRLSSTLRRGLYTVAGILFFLIFLIVIIPIKICYRCFVFRSGQEFVQAEGLAVVLDDDEPQGPLNDDSRAIPAGGADVGSLAQSKYCTVLSSCVARWVRSGASVVNPRRSHLFLVSDSTFH